MITHKKYNIFGSTYNPVVFIVKSAQKLCCKKTFPKTFQNPPRQVNKLLTKTQLFIFAAFALEAIKSGQSWLASNSFSTQLEFSVIMTCKCGKLIFIYLPTVPSTFRKAELPMRRGTTMLYQRLL